MPSGPDTIYDKATAEKDLASALRDASNLLQTDESSKQIHHDLKSVLEARLTQYYSTKDRQRTPETLNTLEDVQLLIAREMLSVVERIQRLLSIEDDTVVPAIGTRDLSQIRTLLSVVFKWGIEPLLAHVREAWPSKMSTSTPVARYTSPSPATSRIVDLSGTPDNYSLLSQLIPRVISLILPNGVRGKLPRTLITTTLLDRHFTDILQPAFTLGWLPRNLSTESMPTVDELRPLVMRLLSILPTSQTIASLGSILSSTSPLPIHVFRTCTAMLSRQLLRPDGVQGLFAAVFGEEESTGGDVAVEKLGHVATVLNAVPSDMKPKDYFKHVIPKVIVLLSAKSPPAYRRASAFTISRMLSIDNAQEFYALRKRIIFELLHGPLLRVEDTEGKDLQALESPSYEAARRTHLRPDVALDALLVLLSNADPSPSFTSGLLSPIVPALYSLLYHMAKVKTSDPQLKEHLQDMLLTWGKIVATNEGLEILWSIIKNGKKVGWKVDLEGHIYLLPAPERSSALSLLTPSQVSETVDFENPDFDTNIFDLYPDPLHFVKLLKCIDRTDISSDLFVRLLEAYRGEKTRSGGDALRVLLYLQIIVQMQKQLSEGTTSNILKKPQQMLAFIYHVLESANFTSVTKSQETSTQSKWEEKFRIAPTTSLEEDSVEVEGDSDDDIPDSEVVRPDDELVETALNLLLSVLEADEDLSARTMPILNDIFSLLEPLSKDGSSSIKPLAREARLVMTARLASGSQPRKTKQKTEGEESAQEVYQNALKLLQDPILPVRAHGLLLLRQLVTPSQHRGKGKGRGESVAQSVDPALTPAILSIFLQSVQDEDSYIFLNSVQGLAAMVDGLGKEVLKGLINEYAGKLEGLGASVVTQQEVDVRTRVGEALGVVIKRCGEALGIYTDILIPPLFKLIRTPGIPATLRTSSISLLADCVNTYPLAALTYIEDLTSAMIDLLQIEGVPIQQQHSKPGSEKHVEESKENIREKQKEKKIEKEEKQAPEGKAERPREKMDNMPTSTNSKFPPLRRAALHFLGILIKEATRQIYETSDRDTFLPSAVINRTLVTLGYVASTDEDSVVRVMAREAKENLGNLQKARLGL